MAAVAHKLKPKPLKTFHATMLVTRIEEWWIEAADANEAQTLLASGEGQRAALGECVQVELESILETADD